jgi:ligand-binding SRPBCC domain-containing protein
MQTVNETTRLPAPADAIWAAVTVSPDAFRFVTRGLVALPAVRRWDRTPAAGDRLHGRLWLFGVIPAWHHTIEFVDVDQARRRMVTEEHGGMLRRWRHTIEVEPDGADACRYRDRVDIDAGLTTPVVVGIARVFYRLRQRRWHTIARLLRAGTGLA